MATITLPTMSTATSPQPLPANRSTGPNRFQTWMKRSWNTLMRRWSGWGTSCWYWPKTGRSSWGWRRGKNGHWGWSVLSTSSVSVPFQYWHRSSTKWQCYTTFPPAHMVYKSVGRIWISFHHNLSLSTIGCRTDLQHSPGGGFLYVSVYRPHDAVDRPQVHVHVGRLPVRYVQLAVWHAAVRRRRPPVYYFVFHRTRSGRRRSVSFLDGRRHLRGQLVSRQNQCNHGIITKDYTQQSINNWMNHLSGNIGNVYWTRIFHWTFDWRWNDIDLDWITFCSDCVFWNWWMQVLCSHWEDSNSRFILWDRWCCWRYRLAWNYSPTRTITTPIGPILVQKSLSFLKYRPFSSFAWSWLSRPALGASWNRHSSSTCNKYTKVITHWMHSNWIELIRNDENFSSNWLRISSACSSSSRPSVTPFPVRFGVG